MKINQKKKFLFIVLMGVELSRNEWIKIEDF
jgi:hypothetical protein